jgi:tRNA pseudouridine38-40 synthase
VRLKLTLEYDGTDFHGWAAQPGVRTVEGVVADALRSLFSEVEKLAVAGRTDTGVHALGNVVSADVAGGPPVERVPEALSALLPEDVAAVAAEEAESDFHARHSARSRSYRYRIYRRRERSPLEVRRSWWYPRRIDLDAVAASADLLAGEHDFRAFTPTETQHDVFVRRVLSATWHERGEHLDFEITADSFLRHMVRTLVGTMLERQPEAMARLLQGGSRPDAGATAPPWGLYLLAVGY